MLSDFGCIICSFDGSSDFDNINIGSTITFNTVKRNRGKNYTLTSIQYDSCIETTFDICKDPCLFSSQKELAFTDDELKLLLRWLNRNQFSKLRFIQEEYDTESCYYNASFNIERIDIAGKTYGLRLTMTTDSPFAHGEKQTIELDFTDITQKQEIFDTSDDVGSDYVNFSIECLDDGDLIIKNSFNGKSIIFLNCKNGEVIDVDGENFIVTTSSQTHKIYNNFNFEFLQIGNTYDNRVNEISVTLPCVIKIEYEPIVKVVL